MSTDTTTQSMLLQLHLYMYMYSVVYTCVLNSSSSLILYSDLLLSRRDAEIMREKQLKKQADSGK